MIITPNQQSCCHTVQKIPFQHLERKLKVPFVLSAGPAGSEAAAAGLLNHHKGHGKPYSGHSIAQISVPSLFLRAWKMKHESSFREKPFPRLSSIASK